MKTAIVGYGSLIRGDDAVGLKAVEEIKKKLGKDSGIGYFYGYNAVDLLGEFENYEKMIMIDAAAIDKKPGEYIRVKMEDIDFPDDTSSSHGANFKNLINTSKTMGIKPPEIIFYLIKPKKMEMGEDMLPEVKEGLNKMIKQIMNEITS